MNKQNRTLFTILMLLQVADLMSTYLGTQHNFNNEANPVMKVILSHYGYLGALVAKIVFGTLAYFVLKYLEQGKDPKLAPILLHVNNGIYTCIVLSNLTQYWLSHYQTSYRTVALALSLTTISLYLIYLKINQTLKN